MKATSELRRFLPFLGSLLLAGPSLLEAQVLSGSYAGNGANNRAITGLGFRPDVVIIKSNDTTNDETLIRTTTMAGNVTKSFIMNAAHPLPDRIQSLDADGFTVGNATGSQAEANTVGFTYYWTAFKVVPGQMKLGTYTGNGADNRSITGVGFQPDYVVVMPDSPTRATQRSSAMAGDVSFDFDGAALTNTIQALEAGGFQLGTSTDVNGNGVTYHYAAWKATPGKMSVGTYGGNGVDNRSIGGVGFQPEYVIVTRNGVDTSVHRPASVGPSNDLSLWFICYTCAISDLVQRLEPNGFQVGTHTAVNGAGNTYYWAAFGNGGAGSCCALGTSRTATTVTVTGPSQFELRYNTATGGGVDLFYDLTEDPSRATDLAGGTAESTSLFHFSMRSGGIFYSTSTFDAGAKLEVLEATPTRVRVRQEAAFENTASTNVFIPTLRGVSDYSIQPSGRLALRFNLRSTNTVSYDDQGLEIVVRYSSVGGNPLNNWTAHRELGTTFGVPPNSFGDDDWIMMKNDSPGVRTDFLHIMSRDWLNPPYLEAADYSDFFQNGGNNYAFVNWRHAGATSLTGTTDQVWNFLTYFKPTSFIDRLDPQVTDRRADYRSPDDISVADFAAGARWDEDGNNDGFNESEAAYTFDLHPVNGLTFDMNGTTTRFQPFFKIRQWRSLSEPSTVTLEGVTLTNDVQYSSDVKPIARAHFAEDILWYSTMGAAGVITTPNIGGAATVAGTVTYPVTRYGRGALFTAASENLTFPSAGNFNVARGAVDFWYQPRYVHADGVRHVLWHNDGDATHSFLLEKTAANSLVFSIRNGATTSGVTVTSTNFYWANRDYVHVRVTWDESAPAGQTARLFLNGFEPVHTDGAAYSSAGMVVGTNYFGSDSAGANSATGILDELHVLSTATASTPLARGGVLSDSSEFFASGTQNFQIGFVGVDALRRGKFLYIGLDSKFRGLNVALQTAGTGVAAGDLEWEYWGGINWGWVSLEAIAGFTDPTDSFTRKNGTLFWTEDPLEWSLYSFLGGPELYYVRVYLKNGASYGTLPREGIIKSDILLLQMCGNVTGSADTFVFPVPTPTAVALSSFDANGVEGAVELDWETASELSNLGFHVYRATEEKGPYARLTSSLIPGLGSSPVGARYRYRDADVAEGIRYYYELEDVETTGKTTRHGPVSATPGAGVSEPELPQALVAFGNPAGNGFRILSHGPGGALVELVTEGFYAVPQDDGAVLLDIPGLERFGGSGSPSIPLARPWIDAVTGRNVAIVSVQTSGLESFAGLRPAGSETFEIVGNRGGVVRASRRARRSPAVSASLFPEAAARLLQVGFQGDSKKAQLEIAPLRWDGARGELLLARRITVRLSFSGTAADGRGRRRREGEASERRVLTRLVATGQGLYQVSFEQVFGRGRAIATDSLRLSRLGDPVAFHVEPDARRFGPGSELFFWSDGAALNPYGFEAVYELALAAGGTSMESGRAAPAGETSPFYWKRAPFEQNRYYQAALLDAPDPWLWDVLLSPVRKGFAFDVSGIAPSAEPARISVWLQGTSDLDGSPDHHVRIYLNGAFVEELFWDGKEARRVESVLPAGALKEGENLLEVENVGDTGAAYSMVMLDRFSVEYPRLPVAEDGVLAGRWSQSGTAEVRGLESAYVLDVTGKSPRWLTGASPSAEGGLRFRVEAGHEYRVVDRSSTRRPFVRRAPAGSLRKSARPVDYLVVGPREFAAAASPLLEHRQQQGLRVRFVGVESVYDEFGFGEARPEAIRDFIAHAYHEWPAPGVRYVLLLGDATYDFKDYLRTGVVNRVPPLMVRTSYLWTASDPTFAAVHGEDLLPDVAIGRLPARTVDELRAMIEKILAYESGETSTEGLIVLVTDRPDRAGDFVANAEELRRGVLAGRDVRHISTRELGAATRSEIRAQLDAGSSLMSYIGHGGIHLWSNENILDIRDVASLSPQRQKPLLLTMNCLNGYFHFPYFDSLSESLLKADGRGIIAAFSPSGLSLDAPAHLYHQALLRSVLDRRHERLGDAVLAAQADYAGTGAFPELLSIYHLLGDPALTLR